MENTNAPVEVTAETVTDEQIRQLLKDIDARIVKAARCALGLSRGGATAQQRARAVCASAINARAKAKAVQPVDVTAESLGDIDFMDFSSKLRTEMDGLDGAAWQAAEDLRQACFTARVYNDADARRRVAAAINSRNAAVRK